MVVMSASAILPMSVASVAQVATADQSSRKETRTLLTGASNTVFPIAVPIGRYSRLQLSEIVNLSGSNTEPFACWPAQMSRRFLVAA